MIEDQCVKWRKVKRRITAAEKDGGGDEESSRTSMCHLLASCVTPLRSKARWILGLLVRGRLGLLSDTTSSSRNPPSLFKFLLPPEGERQGGGASTTMVRGPKESPWNPEVGVVTATGLCFEVGRGVGSAKRRK